MSVILTPAVDLSKVKMKWQETYVSEGLNRKVIPSQPRGIYRGLRIVQNISSPRQIEVAPDPVSGEHEAIYQTTDGFSLSYRDENIGSMIFSLAAAEFDNQETIVALLMDYQIGVDTTATFIAYNRADFDALPAGVRDELVILGTVNCPGAGINITEAEITPDRRTLPWSNRAPGDVDWYPVIRNGGFEHGETGGTYQYAVPFWELTLSGNKKWSAIDTDSNTGLKSLKLESDGTTTLEVVQQVNVPVEAGDFVRVQFFKKLLKDLSSETGTLGVMLQFGDKDGVNSGPFDVVVPVALDVVDGSFVKVEHLVKAPVGSAVLRRVRVFADTLTIPSSGDVVLFDDVQVWVESKGSLGSRRDQDARMKEVSAHPLVLDDPDNAFDGNAAILEFDRSSPASEGGIIVSNRNVVAGGLPPAVHLLGRMMSLGDNLIGSVADALKARTSGTVRAGAGVRTLIQEWSTGTNGNVRMYMDATGAYEVTLNARWDGSLWNKDPGSTGAEASRMRQTQAEVRWDRRSTLAAPWADGAWVTSVSIDMSTGRIETDYIPDVGDPGATVMTVGGIGRFVGADAMVWSAGSTGTSTSGTPRYLWPTYYPATATAGGTSARRLRFGAEVITVKEMAVWVRITASVTCSFALIKNLGGGGTEVIGPTLVLPSGAKFAEAGFDFLMSITAGWDMVCRVIPAGVNPIPSPSDIILRVAYTRTT